MKKSLTEGRREKKKRIAQVIPQTHNYGPPTVFLYFHVNVI